MSDEHRSAQRDLIERAPWVGNSLPYKTRIYSLVISIFGVVCATIWRKTYAQSAGHEILLYAAAGAVVAGWAALIWDHFVKRKSK